LNWTAVLQALGEAASILTGPAAAQAEQLIGLFEQALPAIEKGVISAQPFIIDAFKLLGNGGQPIPADQWAAKLALLKAQTDAVDAQVQQDDQDQPGN